MSRPTANERRLYRLLLAAAALLSIVTVVAVGPRAVLTVRAWTWPTADGVVEDRSVRREFAYTEIKKYSNVNRYQNRLRISVRYSFAGSSHVTRQLHPGSDWTQVTHLSDASYPVGSRVRVHIDPADPEDAIIDDWMSFSDAVALFVVVAGVAWAIRHRDVLRSLKT